MTENEIFTALYVLSFLAITLLFVIGNVIIDRIKQARADRAKERAREENLLARYQRMHEPPLDYAALEAELAADFPPLAIDKASRLSA
jgi:heme exporter protein D